MKKTILLFFMLACHASFTYAQTWKMVITKNDGTTQELQTADIKNIQYIKEVKEDLNVDQLIIKELYNGGCTKQDGSGFQYDKGMILYNNCPQKIIASNLCIGFCAPYNAQGNNKNYGGDGKLTYESQNFIPMLNGIWYFPGTLEIEPFTQVVININGAIDNTQTVPNSVNYAKPSYYAMYDPESGYVNTSYYPTPSELIPTSHYLKAVKVALGNAWPISVSSPALVLFQIKGTTPAEYATNTANYWYDGGNEGNQVYACVKIPNDWIIDAVEVYAAGYQDKCVKRLTSDIDAGYVWLTNYQGHSLYRNVDQEFTEERSENAGKLVYNYSLGVDGSTDPSGIDAEASIRNGAHIVYLDTNNSTEDFHERQRFSIK